MSSSTFAADYEVFVMSAAVNGVTELKAMGALGEERMSLPAMDCYKFAKHTYS